jgi:hypothetical protein
LIINIHIIQRFVWSMAIIKNQGPGDMKLGILSNSK